MEVALNIAWLVLSAGLVLFCSMYSRPFRRSRGQRIVIAIALACLIAFLLFPVISMTDDLSSGAMIADAPISRHWSPPVAQFAAVAGAAILLAISAQNSSAWADGSILSEPLHPSLEPDSFHLSRRPPPEIR